MVNLIKHFMIVIYDFRVVLTKNYSYYNSRVVIYASKMFIRLATGLASYTRYKLVSRVVNYID